MKLSEIRLKDLTWANVKGFTQGYYRKVKFWFSPPELTYIQEQILWRITLMPTECLVNKECPCKCVVPEKQYEDRACEDGCYPEMFDEDTWRLLKKTEPIEMPFIRNWAKDRCKTYNIKLDFEW